MSSEHGEHSVEIVRTEEFARLEVQELSDALEAAGVHVETAIVFGSAVNGKNRSRLSEERERNRAGWDVDVMMITPSIAAIENTDAWIRTNGGRVYNSNFPEKRGMTFQERQHMGWPRPKAGLHVFVLERDYVVEQLQQDGTSIVKQAMNEGVVLQGVIDQRISEVLAQREMASPRNNGSEVSWAVFEIPA